MITGFTVLQVFPSEVEDALSGGHFIVGQDFAGTVLWPDEASARYAAVTYARKLAESGSYRFIVRRTRTEIVYDTRPS